MISRLRFVCACIGALVLQSLPRIAHAGGGGLETPEKLEHDVPLEGLSGINLFFARTYNDNLLLYAIYCTVLMAVVGIAIAFVTDLVLKGMGMEVEKIEHKE